VRTWREYRARQRQAARRYLERILRQARNMTHAARLAGQRRPDFYRTLRAHGLFPPYFQRIRKVDIARAEWRARNRRHPAPIRRYLPPRDLQAPGPRAHG